MNPDSRPTSSSSKPSKGWQPPTLEEMQAMLPQYEFISLLGRGGMAPDRMSISISKSSLLHLMQ